jgi:retron-type reverse transcriptase
MDYKNIISIENLLEAWQEFLRGKKNKKDVSEFSLNLSNNIFCLNKELKDLSYKHGFYESFKINDPKPRDIHKALVRDRLLHHALYRVLYPFYDKKFSHSSFSCRINKGTHEAGKYFRECFLKESKNSTRTCWVLKCDIKKFFANIDHNILISILEKNNKDNDLINLLKEIISSFNSGKVGVGLPLGNLTSQLFVNIYMNEFDQFLKHKSKVKYYVRYCDDFVILSHDKTFLENLLKGIKLYLNNHLKLELHPNKVSINTFASGVDFLGWVHFPKHKVLRTVTKRRMFKRLREVDFKEETKQSYLGLLKHGNTFKIQFRIER